MGWTARVGHVGMIASKQRLAVKALAVRIGQMAGGKKTEVEKWGKDWFIWIR